MRQYQQQQQQQWGKGSEQGVWVLLGDTPANRRRRRRRVGHSRLWKEVGRLLAVQFIEAEKRTRKWKEKKTHGKCDYGISD
ncbi:hypothetical protein ACLKA7_000510 [Drosophila subpalustris]